MKQEDIGIKIKVFGNVYIGSDKHEFHLYKLHNKKDKDGNDIETKEYLSHYSTLIGLLNNFPNIYIKNYSTAKSVEELKNDLKEIYKILDELNLKI